MNRYILAVDKSSNQTDEILAKYFNDNNIGYWHWIESFWLLATDGKELDPNEFSKKVMDLIGERSVFVANITGGVWSGKFANVDESCNTWLKKYYTGV